MSTLGSPREFICNTTPIRIFALVGQFHLVVAVLGSPVHLPRQVLDLDEEVMAAPSKEFLSEIGQIERQFARQIGDPDAAEARERLRALRTGVNLQIVDLEADELELFAELESRALARSMGLAARLGAGEAAAMAIAISRDWGVVIDDAAARQVLSKRSPKTPIRTSRQVLRLAVTDAGILTTGEADIIYDDMKANRYRGPPTLWQD